MTYDRRGLRNREAGDRRRWRASRECWGLATGPQQPQHCGLNPWQFCGPHIPGVGRGEGPSAWQPANGLLVHDPASLTKAPAGRPLLSSVIGAEPAPPSKDLRREGRGRAGRLPGALEGREGRRRPNPGCVRKLQLPCPRRGLHWVREPEALPWFPNSPRGSHASPRPWG